MRKVFALTAVAGLAAIASAQPATGVFTWEVRPGSSGPWSSSITVNPGDAYQIRGTAAWTDGATASVGFAGATFEQIDLAGADASDSFGGASGAGGSPTYVTRRQGVAETWQLWAGTGASAGGLKIDNAVETNRTNFGQLPAILPGGIPNPDFMSSNPLTVFIMDAVAGDDGRTITISSTWTRLGSPASNEFKIYTTQTGTNKKPAQEATRVDATVEIVPAPASLALLGLGGLVAGRRRR